MVAVVVQFIRALINNNLLCTIIKEKKLNFFSILWNLHKKFSFEMRRWFCVHRWISMLMLILYSLTLSFLFHSISYITAIFLFISVLELLRTCIIFPFIHNERITLEIQFSNKLQAEYGIIKIEPPRYIFSLFFCSFCFMLKLLVEQLFSIIISHFYMFHFSDRWFSVLRNSKLLLDAALVLGMLGDLINIYTINSLDLVDVKE